MDPRPSPKEIRDIRILEKLGGGNFGEVYKGLWKIR